MAKGVLKIWNAIEGEWVPIIGGSPGAGASTDAELTITSTFTGNLTGVTGNQQAVNEAIDRFRLGLGVSVAVKNVICMGDSNTFSDANCGVGAYVLEPYEYWPSVVQSKFSMQSVLFDNLGLCSTDVADTIDRYTALALPRYVENGSNHLIIMIGTNNSSGVAATVFSALAGLVDTAVVDGFEVFLCTYPPAQGQTSKNTFLMALNTLIRDNAALHNYTVIELWNAVVGTDNDSWADSSLIHTDNLHLTPDGQAVIANIIATEFAKSQPIITTTATNTYCTLDPNNSEIIAGSDTVYINSTANTTIRNYGRSILISKLDHFDSSGVYAQSLATGYFGAGTATDDRGSHALLFAYHPECVITTERHYNSDVRLKRGAQITDLRHFSPTTSVQADFTGSYSTDAAGYPVGSTHINLSGTGTILFDDYISFGADTNWYRIKTGITASGFITLADPLLVEIPASVTAVVFPTGAEITTESVYWCGALSGLTKYCLNSINASVPSYHAGAFTIGSTLTVAGVVSTDEVIATGFAGAANTAAPCPHGLNLNRLGTGSRLNFNDLAGGTTVASVGSYSDLYLDLYSLYDMVFRSSGQTLQLTSAKFGYWGLTVGGASIDADIAHKHGQYLTTSAAASTYGTISGETWTGTHDFTGATVTTSDVTLTGQASRSLRSARHTTSDTAGNNLLISAGGATSGATNKNGGALYISPGETTGSGRAEVIIGGYGRVAASTSDNIYENRVYIPSSIPVVCDNSTLNTLFTVTVDTKTPTTPYKHSGGFFSYSVVATEGTLTDSVIESGCVVWGAIKKTSTDPVAKITKVAFDALPTQAGDTITVTFSYSVSGNVVTFNVKVAVSGFTADVGHIRIVVDNNGNRALTIS